MKQKTHSLVEHWNDVSMWWHDSRDVYSVSDQVHQTIFLIAYERWLNDRPLLTVEDGYVWKWEQPRRGTIA